MALALAAALVPAFASQPQDERARALAACSGTAFINGSNPLYRGLMSGPVVVSDLWADEPAILSASYGFDGIINID
eukprot:5298099-Pleurochrysis_carterae.AAC.1